MGTVFLYLAPFIGFIIDSMSRAPYSRGAPDINSLHYAHACCVVKCNLLSSAIPVSLGSLLATNEQNINRLTLITTEYDFKKFCRRTLVVMVQ